MKYGGMSQSAECAKPNRKNRPWKNILAVAVVLCTAYAMIMPGTAAGDTIDGETKAAAGQAMQLSYSGEDYTVQVDFTKAAGLSDDVTLSARELKGREYEESCSKAKKAMKVDELSFARFFDVSLSEDGREVEPAAPVDVKITYDEPVDVEKDQVKKAVHFTEDGTELLDAKLAQKDGESTFEFTQDSFSVVGTAVGYTVALAAANDATPGVFNETVSPASSVINVFDYWIDEDNRFPAGGDGNVNSQLTEGINSGHALKFRKNYGGSGSCNSYVSDSVHGDGNNVQQGIVNRTLYNGYPKLSGSQSIVNGGTESLAYLFNPDYSGAETGYRKVFKGAQNLLYNRDGYYTYDSTEHYAYLNENDKQSNSTEVGNNFTLYDDWAVESNGYKGQFFPFNTYPSEKGIGATDQSLYHYFGVTLTARFIQEYGGYTSESKKTPTTFNFSGDDDVWIFIDDVLVADLGGIHNKINTTIDFSTGNVEISFTNPTTGVLTQLEDRHTTIKDAFVAAGRNGDESNWKGNTFADNTTHTLKFFYLERGNGESNMSLQYNLSEIPNTAIYKVDQYGEKVPGAKFAVYAADENYNMLTDKGGSTVSEPSNPSYDSNGNFTDNNGRQVKALYTGTTNENGEMLFVNGDGMPCAINELKDMFGNHFILREIQVPEGYRVVSKDVHLQIWEDGMKPILKCDNTNESGSRAASTLQVTATDTLHLRRPYNGSSTVEYHKADGTTLGTLFAVIFKYTGAVDDDGNATLEDINNSDNWRPVSGNDTDGYTVEPGGELADALNAAKKQDEKDVLFKPSSNGTMQLTMEDLPGHITQYYRMLSDENKNDARYTVGYYWISESSLDTAEADNTYRVYTYGEVADNVSASPFDRVFGANIQVPNLKNMLMVQKTDKSGTLINDANFAIYQVQQDGNGTIRYKDQNGNFTELTADAAPDPDTGNITVGSHIIKPIQIDTTKRIGTEDGTVEFSNLNEGQYIVKEIKAPDGFLMNTSDVMVLVTEDTIYANAGTAKDGVAVGRGPGYLVRPLHQFASEGQIDNTLSWIYARMRISGNSESFADATAPNDSWGYLTKNNSGETGGEEQAAISYLKYGADEDENKAFNYVPNEERNAESGAQNPTGSRRLFTTVGWNQYEILQDYVYGLDKAKASGADYEDWSGQNLMNLFSRSTYIRVKDRRENALRIKKVDKNADDTTLAGAQFRLYRIDGSGSNEYYKQNADGTVEWVANEEQALTVTTGDDGFSDADFTGLSDGTYYLEEIRAPHEHCLLENPLRLTLDDEEISLSDADLSFGHKIDAGELDTATNLFTYTLTAADQGLYELPSAGGSGTIPYTIGGLLLIAAAGVLMLYNNKRHNLS